MRSNMITFAFAAATLSSSSPHAQSLDYGETPQDDPIPNVASLEEPAKTQICAFNALRSVHSRPDVSARMSAGVGRADYTPKTDVENAALYADYRDHPVRNRWFHNDVVQVFDGTEIRFDSFLYHNENAFGYSSRWIYEDTPAPVVETQIKRDAELREENIFNCLPEANYGCLKLYYIRKTCVH